MEPKYDMSVLMPITDATKAFYRRYEDQKKYGFLNRKDRKLQLLLLIGPGEDFYGNDVTLGWPSDMDVKVVESPYVDVARKIVYYYQNQTEEEIMSARWHAKFDDDTVNDVDQLLTWIDEDFDWQKATYIVTELRSEIEEREGAVLRKMGYAHLFDDRFWISDRIKHEWEGSLVSPPALLEARNNPKSQQYFTERLKLDGGLGDQCLGMALYFCKIHPHAASYMSYWNKVPDFTLFGGRIAHVHLQLERNVETLWMNLLKAIIDVKSTPGTEAVVGKHWIFSKEDNEYIGRHFFSKDGRVISDHKMSIALWGPAKKPEAILLLFNNAPWRGYELIPRDDGFEGRCPDTGQWIRIKPA